MAKSSLSRTLCPTQLCDERQHRYNNRLRRRISMHSVPPLTSTLSPLHPLSFVTTRNPRAHGAPGNVTRGVALKPIPKKQVKGNEESVWNEMGATGSQSSQYRASLFPTLFSIMRLCASPNMLGCLSVGQIL
jgi:hypothetical protein